MSYQRISTKWCPRHPPAPASFRDRIRKWLHRPYRYKQGIWCDCPGPTINVGAINGEESHE